jgi:hypothetical protein
MVLHLPSGSRENNFRADGCFSRKSRAAAPYRSNYSVQEFLPNVKFWYLPLFYAVFEMGDIVSSLFGHNDLKRLGEDGGGERGLTVDLAIDPDVLRGICLQGNFFAAPMVNACR